MPWSSSDNWLGSTTYSGGFYASGGWDPSTGWVINDWGFGVNANIDFGKPLTLPTHRPSAFASKVNETIWDDDEDYAEFWKDVDLKTGEYLGADDRWEAQEFQEFWGDVDLEYGMYTGHDLKWLAGNADDGGYSGNQFVDYIHWAQGKGESTSAILEELGNRGVPSPTAQVAALYGIPNEKAAVEDFMTSNAEFWSFYDAEKKTFSKLGTDLYGKPLVTGYPDPTATADAWGNRNTYLNHKGEKLSALLPTGELIYKGNLEYLPNIGGYTDVFTGAVTKVEYPHNYFSTLLPATVREKVDLAKGVSGKSWYDYLGNFSRDTQAGLWGDDFTPNETMTLSLPKYIDAQQDAGVSTDDILYRLGNAGFNTQAVGEVYGIEPSEVSNFLTENAKFWGRYDKATGLFDYTDIGEGYLPNLGGLSENYELTGGLVTNFDNTPFSGILPNGQVVSNGVFASQGSTFSPISDAPPQLAPSITGTTAATTDPDSHDYNHLYNYNGTLNPEGQQFVANAIDASQRAGELTTAEILAITTEHGFTNDIISEMYNIESSELANFLTENATFWSHFDSAKGEFIYDSTEVSQYLPVLTGLDSEGNPIAGELVRYSNLGGGFEKEKLFTGQLHNGDVYNEGKWVAKDNNLIPSGIASSLLNNIPGVNIITSLVEAGYDFVYTNGMDPLSLSDVGEITKASNLIKNIVNAGAIEVPMGQLASGLLTGESIGQIVQNAFFHGIEDGVIDTADAWMDKLTSQSIIETVSNLATQVTGLPVDSALSAVVEYLQSDTHTTNPFSLSSTDTAFNFKTINAPKISAVDRGSYVNNVLNYLKATADQGGYVTELYDPVTGELFAPTLSDNGDGSYTDQDGVIIWDYGNPKAVRNARYTNPSGEVFAVTPVNDTLLISSLESMDSESGTVVALLVPSGDGHTYQSQLYDENQSPIQGVEGQGVVDFNIIDGDSSYVTGRNFDQFMAGEFGDAERFNPLKSLSSVMSVEVFDLDTFQQFIADAKDSTTTSLLNLVDYKAAPTPAPRPQVHRNKPNLD